MPCRCGRGGGAFEELGDAVADEVLVGVGGVGGEAVGGEGGVGGVGEVGEGVEEGAVEVEEDGFEGHGGRIRMRARMKKRGVDVGWIPDGVAATCGDFWVGMKRGGAGLDWAVGVFLFGRMGRWAMWL